MTVEEQIEEQVELLRSTRISPETKSQAARWIGTRGVAALGAMGALIVACESPHRCVREEVLKALARLDRALSDAGKRDVVVRSLQAVVSCERGPGKQAVRTAYALERLELLREIRALEGGK